MATGAASDRNRPAEPAVRAFVAVEVGGTARARIEALLRALARTAADVRWIRPDQIHVTLQFLGRVPETRVEPLAAALAAAAAATAPFPLVVAGCGGFPSLARPRVVWVGADAPPLAGLAAAVRAACARLGFPPETRPFRAHVTLGRVRERGRLDAAARRLLAEADAAGVLGRATVGDVVLSRSELSPRGARYTALARLPLGGHLTDGA